MHSKLRTIRRVAPLALLPLAVAACAEDKPLNTFEPRGPQAESIDNLMLYIWPIMGIVFVLVIGGAIWIAMRNRVKPEDFDYEDLPEQTHGNIPLELTWTIAPTILLAVISGFMVQQIWDLETENEAGELDVMVIGQQWWWEYRYDVDGDGFIQDGNGDGVVDDHDWTLPLELILDPDDVVTANELVIPAGEQIDLRLTSRDVIHSFWIPRLNGKRDTVPGRWHTWSLEAFEPGKYTGWCTEYCGLSHARMRMSTIALPEAEFDEWLANQATLADVPTSGDELAGYELFQNQCASCHVINDGNLDYTTYDPPLVPGAAPNLTHFATRTTFAGGIYNQYTGPGTEATDDALDVSTYLDLAALSADPQTREDVRWNSAELKRWIANAPEQKAMDADNQRGMIAFPQLSDEDLDNIVAYLATLD
ncbi:MAG: cytochrome c oxidase subunit II [Actinomycetota bacterium]